jgi:hypothetical protein
MIMWWEPLKRVSQPSHGEISSLGPCPPDVWDNNMHPRHRLLLDVWDDAMFTPATGYSKTVSAYQGKSPHIKEIGFCWD